VICITAAIAIGAAGDGERGRMAPCKRWFGLCQARWWPPFPWCWPTVRAQTPEHSMSLCGHTRSVQRNWRSTEVSSSNLGIRALPGYGPILSCDERAGRQEWGSIACRL